MTGFIQLALLWLVGVGVISFAYVREWVEEFWGVMALGVWTGICAGVLIGQAYSI